MTGHGTLVKAENMRLYSWTTHAANQNPVQSLWEKLPIPHSTKELVSEWSACNITPYKPSRMMEEDSSLGGSSREEELWHRGWKWRKLSTCEHNEDAFPDPNHYHQTTYLSIWIPSSSNKSLNVHSVSIQGTAHKPLTPCAVQNSQPPSSEHCTLAQSLPVRKPCKSIAQMHCISHMENFPWNLGGNSSVSVTSNMRRHQNQCYSRPFPDLLPVAISTLTPVSVGQSLYFRSEPTLFPCSQSTLNYLSYDDQRPGIFALFLAASTHW